MFFRRDFCGVARSSGMKRRTSARLLASLLLGAMASGCVTNAPPVQSPSAGSAGQEDIESRGQLWMIPSTQAGLSMRATLFRPPGEGPFPLAVINHGSEQDPANRSLMPMPAFKSVTAWFLERGYAVLLPQRPGHGETGGRYLENQGACWSASFERAGDATADNIEAAVDFMVRQPFIKPTGVVVIGNSAGGLGALALASRNPAGVIGIVNFSGGRGGRDFNRPGKNCSPERLVAAASTFGRTARMPTLWLYASNDSYFPPALSQEMAEAFRSAGGTVDYRLLPAVGKEGHRLIYAPTTVWGSYLDAFLTRSGG
jgi:dienelactone hydrolase